MRHNFWKRVVLNLLVSIDNDCFLHSYINFAGCPDPLLKNCIFIFGIYRNTGGNDNTWESSSSSSSSESDSDDDKVATTKKNKDTKEIARVSSISNKAKIESSTVRLEKNPGNLGKKTSQTNAITNLPVVDKSNARPPSNHHEPT